MAGGWKHGAEAMSTAPWASRVLSARAAVACGWIHSPEPLSWAQWDVSAQICQCRRGME